MSNQGVALRKRPAGLRQNVQRPGYVANDIVFHKAESIVIETA
jgi:hypothetical protein